MSNTELRLESVQLPGTDLTVSKISLGTADFGSKISEEESLKQFERYRALGGNFLDSAHCYAAWAGKLGISDVITGKIAKEFGRSGLVIATKVGHVGYDGYPRPDRFCTPELMISDLDESLERMQLDSVDLVYLHRDDPRHTVAELLDGAQALVESGKTRYVAASNWSLARLRRAKQHADKQGIRGFVAIQNQWALAVPTWEGQEGPGVVRTGKRKDCEELASLGLSVIPYSPNANGFFAKGGGISSYETAENLAKLARVQELAKQIGATPGEVALAYLDHPTATVVPIIGSTREATLLEAVRGSQLRLTEEQKNALDTAV
jgi:aryl-alcohol dehydrogenase-like predicted oxidoreductase